MAGQPDVSCTSHRSKSLVVAVEGNIGAGKSTFLEYCAQHSELSFQTYPEPVDQWQSFYGTNVLSEYYSNPAKWAIPFQLLVGMTVGDNYRKHTWKRIKLIERSLLSSRYVFMENLIRKNVIEQGMADIMGTWYDRMLEDGELKPHVIVYLRTTPPVALSRLQARARSAENSVTLGQLEDIHVLHEEWLEQVHIRNSAYDEPEMPVFTVDADLQLNDVYLQYEKCIKFGFRRLCNSRINIKYISQYVSFIVEYISFIVEL